MQTAGMKIVFKQFKAYLFDKQYIKNKIDNMKKIIDFTKWAVAISIALAFSACSVYSYTSPSPAPVNDYPEWAPYYSDARYYYLPDIETYYDINAREFVYLYNGRWSYYRNLPPQYADYDLYNCYTIVLNRDTYQPWMHHQYYVSHYPRYYYRDYYDRSNFAYVRGYNENTRSAFYWEEKDYHRARNWDNSNRNNRRNFKYSREDMQQYNSRIAINNDRNRGNNYDTSRPPVNTNNQNTSNDRNTGEKSAGLSIIKIQKTSVTILITATRTAVPTAM